MEEAEFESNEGFKVDPGTRVLSSKISKKKQILP